MAVIGVYDSGIGGLTTAKIILDRFVGNDLYYLADNLNHPFGTKDENSLKEIVSSGIKRLKSHSDIVVLACNTASSIYDGTDVIKLLPPLNDFADEAEETLLMATVRTLNKVQNADGFKIADTPNLATLTEVQASLNYLRGSLNMDELTDYLAPRLKPFEGVKRVILGCSHYLYCKPQISKILGNVAFADGNENLCAQLGEHIVSKPNIPSKITFDFTSANESKKYQKILKILMNC